MLAKTGWLPGRHLTDERVRFGLRSLLLIRTRSRSQDHIGSAAPQRTRSVPLLLLSSVRCYLGPFWGAPRGQQRPHRTDRRERAEPRRPSQANPNTLKFDSRPSSSFSYIPLPSPFPFRLHFSSFTPSTPRLTPLARPPPPSSAMSAGQIEKQQVAHVENRFDQPKIDLAHNLSAK